MSECGKGGEAAGPGRNKGAAQVPASGRLPPSLPQPRALRARSEAAGLDRRPFNGRQVPLGATPPPTHTTAALGRGPPAGLTAAGRRGAACGASGRLGKGRRSRVGGVWGLRFGRAALSVPGAAVRERRGAAALPVSPRDRGFDLRPNEAGSGFGLPGRRGRSLLEPKELLV